MGTYEPPCRLLHVENDLLIGRAASRIFERAERPVRWVPSCAQAKLAAKVEGPYQIGIFDIDLDDGSGVELSCELTSAGLVERVLFFTACQEPSVLEDAARIGTVISKQQGLSALLSALPLRAIPRVMRETGSRPILRHAEMADPTLSQADPTLSQIVKKTAG